jgi:long-chain acyl-CoA synthetase
VNVETFLEQSARSTPDKTALVCDNQRLSYRGIEEQCNRLAHGLVALGVERGDRVAICLDNTVEAVVSIFAVLKAGAVFVLVNTATKPEKLTYILDNCGAKIMIASGQKAAVMQPHATRLPALQTVVLVGKDSDVSAESSRVVSWSRLLAAHRDSIRPPRKTCIDIDIAALIYTSGSTGNPKGVIMSHFNMVSAVGSVLEYLENNADDVILNVLPLSFSYGLYQILTAFKVGATVVLERSFTYPHAVLQRLLEERATGFAIVPTIAAVLLQMDLSEYHFSSLRYMTNAGAALPAEHIARLRTFFPQTLLYLMYGLTECKRVSYLPPDQLDIRPTSVGKPMPNVETLILDEDGQQLGPGKVGELVVRGSNVMRGYWNNPQETDKALRPGPVPGERMLYTGDLFRMDDEGYLYWMGRRDDIIKSRGEKVSPKEIENVLYKLDGVFEAVVVGVPDPVLGQAVKAVITLRKDAALSQTDVQRHCAKHLEEFMMPKFIEFRETMPKTAAGKIDKRELVAERY